MTLDYHINTQQNQIVTDFQAINSFIENYISDVKAKRASASLASKLQEHLISLNLMLKQRVEQAKALRQRAIVADPPNFEADLSHTINFLNSEIEIYSAINSVVDELQKQEGLKPFTDFKITNAYILEYMEYTYDLIRIFKRHNKKVSIPTSQLAKDTAAYSFYTLSKLFNVR